MKDYRYILLDWDGNLAQTLDLWLDAFREVLAIQGINPSDKEICDSFGKADGFAELGVLDSRYLYDKADEIGKARLPNTELYPDALEVLEYFKDINKSTALITTSWRANVDHLLDKYNMWRLFDEVICHEDVYAHKPDPEPIYKALDLLGGSKNTQLLLVIQKQTWVQQQMPA